MVSAPVTARDRRDAVVREHMDSENRDAFDVTLAIFAHPRYEIIPTGQVSTARTRCASTTGRRAPRSPISRTRSAPSTTRTSP